MLTFFSLIDFPANISYHYHVNDERFHRGIQEFNDHRFFEAHDILEELWHEYREEDRLFLQGLIQVAVGYYHLENRNYNGCRSLMGKAIAKLEPYRPEHQGIRVQEIIECMRKCLDVVKDAQQGEIIHVDYQMIPKITYTKVTSAM